MKRIVNSHIGAELYIDDFDVDKRDEEDRYKIYDSDKRYLEYVPYKHIGTLDNGEDAYYFGVCYMLENECSLISLLNFLGVDYEMFDNRESVIREHMGLPNDYNLLDNEYVNRIGKHYIVIKN